MRPSGWFFEAVARGFARISLWQNRKKAQETRRKILLGAFTDHLLKTDAQFAPIYMKFAADYFKRDDDRELIGLPPIAKLAKD